MTMFCLGLNPFLLHLYFYQSCILEIELGILQKERQDPPQGAILRSWLNSHVLPAFSDRIINIDTAIVLRCAKLHIPDRRAERDALIAACALVHGFVVVTRNIKDFEGSGVELIVIFR